MLDHLPPKTEEPGEISSSLPEGLPTDSASSVSTLVEKAMSLASAMQHRLMDSQGNFRKEVPIREGKEAVASISTLLGMVLRNQKILEDREYQRKFDNAVLEVLEVMDAQYRTEFFSLLESKLNQLETG